MGHPRTTPEQVDEFLRRVRRGESIAASARAIGKSTNTGERIVAKYRAAGQDPLARRSIKATPQNWNRLPERAKRAYDDFEYFRTIYLGRISMPWHVAAGQQAIQALETPEESYFVWNMPPSGGKSTLAHDIAAWAIVRNRRNRILFGSKTAGNAERAVKRLSRTMAATFPAKAKPREIELGLACDAETTLAADFGAFKPYGADADTWRASEFIVIQPDGSLISEKEPTVSSFGMDSGFLGNRFDLIFWDDVVDRTTTRTIDAVENQRDWWDDIAESRLDPGGALFLIGQRIASNDLYRYCLDKRRPLTAEEEETFDSADDDTQKQLLEAVPTQYHHEKYQAHDDERCQGKITHRRDAPPWPEGCLLDPRRLHWTKIGALRANKPRTYAIQYQQEDADEDTTLVKKVWVYGGTDLDELTGSRFEAPGCLDFDRGLWELPPGLPSPVHIIATVDPSPTNYWAIQCWAYAPNAMNQMFLLDTIRAKMPANDFLDRDPNTNEYTGIAETWQILSRQMGHPISRWIIEDNGANRFIIQSALHMRWRGLHETIVIPHTTGRNKSDPNYGLDMVRDWWKHGRIRLPWKGAARAASFKLIEEVTRYPNAGTDDQVMAHWFLFNNLARVAVPPSIDQRQARPSWANTLDARRLVAVS